jgi:hypothetical protein
MRAETGRIVLTVGDQQQAIDRRQYSAIADELCVDNAEHVRCRAQRANDPCTYTDHAFKPALVMLLAPRLHHDLDAVVLLVTECLV